MPLIKENIPCHAADCVVYKWVLHPWGECEGECGSDRVQHRRVECKKVRWGIFRDKVVAVALHNCGCICSRYTLYCF